MGEGNEKLVGSENKEEVFSKVIRAGKRTYFLDVKTTRRNDFYLTITESKKKFNRDGRYFFEKHKVFLYREDLENFVDALLTMVDYIRQQDVDIDNYRRVDRDESYNREAIQDSYDHDLEEVEVEVDSYSNIDFDDLEEKR